MASPLPDDLLTLAEAARRTGLALATLRRWTWARKISTVRFGRSVRVRASELARVMSETPALPQ